MDNRADAPSRAPGDEPGGKSAADGPDEAGSSATQNGEAGQSDGPAATGADVWTPAASRQRDSAGDSSQAAGPRAADANQAAATPESESATAQPSRPPEPPPGSAYHTPMTPPYDGPAYSLLPPDPVPGSVAAAETAALPSVAAVADSVRDVASRVGSSFSGSFAKLSERTSQFRAGVSQRAANAGAPPVGAAPQHASQHAARPQAARPQAAGPQVRPAPTRGQPRRALLTLERLEPWSVMKFSFLISLVCWVIFFVVVAVLYFTLSKLGVFHAIEKNWDLVTSNKSNPAGSRIADWLSASRILGYTMLIGAINVVLMTALATIGAVLYNLISAITGGIEVTLKESD